MRKFILIAIAALSITGSARAGIILEFFRGWSVNDTVLNTAEPLSFVFVPPAPTSVYVQVALRQTAGTDLLDASDGLAAYLMQAVYGPNFAGNYFVPAANGIPIGTIPLVNVGDPGTYWLIRSYRTGPNGSMPGGNVVTATAFRFGGLNLNPPPSPSVDANGRIFLGAFTLRAASTLLPPSSIVFQDPNPAAHTIDNITDMGDNLDAVLYNGTTYTLLINQVPEPSSFVLAGIVVAGAVGWRFRRKHVIGRAERESVPTRLSAEAHLAPGQ